MAGRFVEFKIAKNGNRAVVRADQVVFFGETPDGIEIVMEHMEGSIVIVSTIDDVMQALTVH